MMKNKSTAYYGIFILALIVTPFVLSSQWVSVATTFLIYSTVSLSQDIVLGRAGMFDMGHALFFGVGAYATAILNMVYGWPIVYTIPVAILLPTIFGIILSAPIVHLRGDYLLVGTLGFNLSLIHI